MAREAFQVDRDIDAVLAGQLGDGSITKSADIMKTVDALFQPGAYHVLARWPVRESVHGKAGTVMRLQQPA